MALMVSNEAANLFLVLAGERFPMANEDQLRALAQGWELAARELHDLDGDLRRDLAATQQGFSGMSADAYDRYVASLTEGDALREVAESMLSSSQFLEKLALDVEYTKYTLIGALIALIAEIAWAIAMAVPSFGASMAWLAARKAMYTILFRTILRKLLAEIAKGAAFNVLSEVAIDAVAQLVQMAEGNRTEWDGDKTSGAAAGGGLAGMFGAVPILGGAGLGKAFGKGAGDGIGDGIGSGVGKGVGDGAGSGAGRGAGDGVDVPPPGRGAGDGVDVPPPGRGAGDGVGVPPPGKGSVGDLPPTTSSGGAPKPHGIKDTAQDIATDFVGEAFVEVMTEGTYSAIQGEGFQVGVGGVLSAASSSIGTGLGTAAGYHAGTAFGGPGPSEGGSGGGDAGTRSDPVAGQTPITDGGAGSALGGGPGLGTGAGPGLSTGSGGGSGSGQGSGSGSGAPQGPRGAPQQGASGEQGAGGEQDAGGQRGAGGRQDVVGGDSTDGRGPLESSTSSAPDPLGGRQEPAGQQGEAVADATPPAAQSQGGPTTSAQDQGSSTDPQQQDGSTADVQHDSAPGSQQQAPETPGAQQGPTRPDGQGTAPQGVTGDPASLRPASQDASVEQGPTVKEGSSVDQGLTVDEGSSVDQGSTVDSGSTVDQGSTVDPGSTVDQGSTVDRDSMAGQDSTTDQDAPTQSDSTPADSTQSDSTQTQQSPASAPPTTTPGSTPPTTTPGAAPTPTPGQASDPTPSADVDATTDGPVPPDASPDGQTQDARDPSAHDPHADVDQQPQRDDATSPEAQTDVVGDDDAASIVNDTDDDAASIVSDTDDDAASIVSDTDDDVSSIVSDADSGVDSDADSDATSITTVDADAGADADVAPRDAAPTAQSPAWQAAYDQAAPKQLRTESFTPARSDGPGVDIRGEIAIVDYVSRDLTVDGAQIRLFEVPVEITADADTMSSDDLRAVVDDVQAHLDAFVNDRFTLGDGHAMQVRIDPTFVASDAPSSDSVRVTVRPEGEVDQRTWSADPKDAPLLVHEVMHFVGAREGYRGDHHLLRTPRRDGVMGDGARDLPRVEDAAKDAPPYLTDADVEHIHATWRDATPQRADFAPTPHGALPPSTSPAQAPGGKRKRDGDASSSKPKRQQTAQGAASPSPSQSPATMPPPPAPPLPSTTTAPADLEKRPLVADPARLDPTPRPNPDGTVPSSIYRAERSARPTQPDVDGAGQPKAYLPDDKLHQVRYGATKGLDPKDLATIGSFLRGTGGPRPALPHDHRVDQLPDQGDIVDAAVAAGDALTSQEQQRLATGSNDGDATRNHIIASGAGQNALNRAILAGIHGRGDVERAESVLADPQAEPADREAARVQREQGNATIASAIGRFQQYQRAVTQEPRASRQQRTDEQVRTDRDDGLVQLSRLVEAPETRDGRSAALDTLDPSAQPSTSTGLTRDDALRSLRRIVGRRLTSQERAVAAPHLATLSATPSPKAPATEQQRAVDALRDLLAPDRRTDYVQVIARSIDSTGNVRVGDRRLNGAVSTGFDAELDMHGEPTPRTRRLFEAHLVAKPDHDEQIFTSVSGSGDRLSSSTQVGPPRHVEPTGNPGDHVRPSAEAARTFHEQQEVDRQLAADGGQPDRFGPDGRDLDQQGDWTRTREGEEALFDASDATSDEDLYGVSDREDSQHRDGAQGRDGTRDHEALPFRGRGEDRGASDIPEAPPLPRPAPPRTPETDAAPPIERRPTPPRRGPDPSIPVRDDEGWRHASDPTAPWSEPTATPIAEADWRPRLTSAPARTVDVTVADVRTDSTTGRLRRFEGFIQYDRARVVVPDGRAVQVYTVRMHLAPGDGVSAADVTATRDRARSSVDAIVNQGYRLPSGDQLHLDVQFVDDASTAHTTIDVVAPVDQIGDTGRGPDGQRPTSTDQRHWRTDEAGQVLTHELLHSLGLADESVDSRRVFQRDADSTAVHHDDGIMGDAVHREGAMLYPRNLWMIERIADGEHQLPEHSYPANDLLQGQPLPLSSIRNPDAMHTQVANHLGVAPDRVRDALGLTDRSTDAQVAEAWRGVLDAGSITVDGHTATVRTADVQMPAVTPVAAETPKPSTDATTSTDDADGADATADGDGKPEPAPKVQEATDAFSRTQDVERSDKTSVSNSAKAELQLTVAMGPTPGFPAATFGMGATTGADLGLKSTLRDTAAPKTGLTPAHAEVTLDLTTDGRTTQVDVDARLTMPEVSHASATAPRQDGRVPGEASTWQNADLRGIEPRRVTTLVDGTVRPRSQRDVDALTGILTASGDAKARGDRSTFSVTDDAPRTAYLGVADGGSKTTRGTAFSSGWSKGVDLSATAGARGRLRSFLRIGGGLTVTSSGQIGGSKETKHSSARSNDDKVAIYSLRRTVQVQPRFGLGSPRSVEVQTTFSVPIADAAARGLWLPAPVRPEGMTMHQGPFRPESTFDPSRDSFVSVPPDLADRIGDGLELSDKGKEAIARTFADDAKAKASMQDAATDGTTAVWHEGGRTHRVTITADVTLGDPGTTVDSRTSKHEESVSSKREITMDSKATQGFTVGSQAIASFASTTSQAAAASPTAEKNWGNAILQLSGGHQRTAKNAAQHTIKDTRAASSIGPAGYHPTRTTLKVVHESTKDPNFLQRGLAGGRLLGSGPTADRHSVVRPDLGQSIEIDGVAVRRPQLDGTTPGATSPRTFVGDVGDPSFQEIDAADLGAYAKVERVSGHDAHASLLEASLSKRADLTTGTGTPHRSPLGSGNFSSWGSRAFDPVAGPTITRSPFTKPGEVTAATVQGLGSDAGLRTIANEGLGDRGVTTGDMVLPGKIRDLHGSVEVKQRLGNPSFVTTRDHRTLMRGSADDRAVGTSKEWSLNGGLDGIVRATAPGGKDNFLAQIGAKLGYTHGRSKEAERSAGIASERSKVGETAVLRFDAERSYKPSLELRRWRWRSGFANPSYTRFEPASVDVELPVREAAALLQKHGIDLPPELVAHAPAPAATTDPTTTNDSTVVADPPVVTPAGIELGSLPPRDPANPPADPANPPADPLAPFRDDSDAVVAESRITKEALARMERSWRPVGIDERTRQQILGEVRRVLTQSSGSGFVRDAMVGPNRITVPLPAGPFTQRTVTIELDVSHRPDAADPATRTDLKGETLSTERSGGSTRKRNRFHLVNFGLDGRLGFFTRPDEVADLPGGEASTQQDWTVFNRRWDRSVSGPESPKLATTAEHESLEQHHVPVTYDVTLQLHEHVGGALDSLLPRAITKGSHTPLAPISVGGTVDILEPTDSPDSLDAPPAPAPAAQQHQLPAVGAWRPVRWDHASVDDVRAAVQESLDARGGDVRPGDVYDEALRTAMSNPMLFNAIPRIVSGETFSVDELIARRGAFRDLRSDLSISGGLVEPSIRPGSKAPSTTLQHTVDLGIGLAEAKKRADDAGMSLPFGLSGMTDAGMVAGVLAPSFKSSSSRTDEQGTDVKTSEKITHKGRSFIVDAHLRLRITAGTSTIVSSGGPRQPGEVDVPVVLQVWEQQLGALGLAVPADTDGDAARAAEAARERDEAAAREDAARAERDAAAQRARDAERREAEERLARHRRQEEQRTEREEAERRERVREEAERREQERLEAERREWERQDAERAEAERREVERQEREHRDERERRAAAADRRERERRREAEQQEADDRQREEQRQDELDRRTEAIERREQQDERRRRAEAAEQRRDQQREATERETAEREAAEREAAERDRRTQADERADAAERRRAQEREAREAHEDETIATPVDERPAPSDEGGRGTEIDDGYEADDDADRMVDDELASVADDEASTATTPRPTTSAPPVETTDGDAASDDETADEFLTASEGEDEADDDAAETESTSEYETAAEYLTASEGEDDEPQARPAPPRPRDVPPVRSEPLPPVAPAQPAPEASDPADASDASGAQSVHDDGATHAPRAGDGDGPTPEQPRDDTWIPDAPTAGYVPEEEDELEDRIVLPDGTLTGDGSTFDAQAFFDDALSRS